VQTPVVVAAKPIPWGVKLDGQYLKVIQLPAADAPQGAYSSVGQILNQDGGAPMALSAMAAQEPVLALEADRPWRTPDPGRPGRSRHARLHHRRHRRHRPAAATSCPATGSMLC